MPPTPTDYDSAEALRKAKKYAQAVVHFEMLWHQNPTAHIGWRYTYCLRKLGKLDEAEQAARSALEKYPEDKFTKSELGWVLYDKELKPAKEEGDLGRIVHFAKQILNLNPDMFALRLLALTVMKVGKDRRKWDVVLEWANRLQASDLNQVSKEIDGKHVMSDREIWYVGKARALLELERYNEARVTANEGLAEFPDELFLARTAALALARSGDIQGGTAEMRILSTHRRADWYVKADLAEFEHKLGNHSDAYQLMCSAISNPQNDEYKLGCFVTLAKIALTLNKFDVAAEHVSLAKAVRMANNWSIPPELTQVEMDVQSAITATGASWPNLPHSVEQLSRICNRRWQEGAIAGLEFIRGTVGTINPDKPFTFIKRDDSSESVFVIVRDIPRKCAHVGARVEFTLKKSFDKKKNRESVQATYVRCAA